MTSIHLPCRTSIPNMPFRRPVHRIITMPSIARRAIENINFDRILTCPKCECKGKKRIHIEGMGNYYFCNCIECGCKFWVLKSDPSEVTHIEKDEGDSQ